MTNLFEFLAIAEDEPEPRGRFPDARRALDRGAPRIEFRDVSFRYPGCRSRRADDVNLVIEPARRSRSSVATARARPR